MIASPRYRVLNVRLSSSEYKNVYSTSQVDGARSVSGFARRVLLEHVEQRLGGTTLRSQLEQLIVRCGAMEQAIMDLVLMLKDRHEPTQ